MKEQIIQYRKALKMQSKVLIVTGIIAIIALIVAGINFLPIHPTYIAIVAFVAFFAALFYCAWVEQKFRTVISFIKRHNKYS